MLDTSFSRPAAVPAHPHRWAASAAAAATLLLAVGSAAIGAAPIADADARPASTAQASATVGEATAAADGLDAGGLRRSSADDPTPVERAAWPWGLAGGAGLAALAAWFVRRRSPSAAAGRHDPHTERRHVLADAAGIFAEVRNALGPAPGGPDPVTGLPSRSELSRLDAELARIPASADIELCVFCIDLDDFRAVNDRFGRVAGDTALRQVAARLRTAAREADVVLRLGGDEFAVIAPCAAGAGDYLTERIATRLLEQMQPPFTGIAPSGVVLGACIGTARWRPGKPTLIESVGQAGEALLAAKRAGRCQRRHYAARRGLRSRRNDAVAGAS